MDTFQKDLANGVLDAQRPPCISLYQPTHRHYPANQQDPIRFRNFTKRLEESLLQRYAAHEIRPLLEPFQTLADDQDFWTHTLDGLAVLAAPDFFRLYRLQRTVDELLIVADSFHTKPLLQVFQSDDRFQILGLSRREIRLFEGNRDALDEIEPAPGVVRTIADALGDQVTEPHLTVASYGGLEGPGMHHGHGDKSEEVDIDAERFFRAVDRGVMERHSRPSELPLLLAALPENQSIFRRVSHNPFLLDQGIDVDPGALTVEALRERAWELFEPHYLAKLDELAEEFKSSESAGLATGELEEAAGAAYAGRIATLLIQADRQIPGRIDPTTGQIEFNNLENPDIDDLLDDLGALVLKKGGKVVVMSAERMPTETGIAAIYRY